jgi:uncharacterized protein
MSCHRIDELLELLTPLWQSKSELNLAALLQQLAQAAGYQGALAELTDDVLIYHLKMQQAGEAKPIPGLMKDHEDDFKTALLRARGVLPKE